MGRGKKRAGRPDDRAQGASIDLCKRRFSTRELNRHLGALLLLATKQPVLIDRYGQPYVWLVSHDTWVETGVTVDDYVSGRHPLVAVAATVDPIIDQHSTFLRNLKVRHRLQIPPGALLRALMLQALYSVPTEGALYDQIGSDMAFRRFVGLGIKERLWDLSRLTREMRVMLRSHHAVLVLQLLLRSAAPVAQRPENGLNLNGALVRAWMMRHREFDLSMPAREWLPGMV
ncbi:Transposase domain (DUF772) [Bordetella ansorpii]|uniref:Transposase domain (DUF772) n=2 Tax=Bordetella ansorpii TaxID=288768 RepID=A0A157QNH8_9BORD|nr:Transposase domain (DUF772) [Bordetella ansorpii]